MTFISRLLLLTLFGGMLTACSLRPPSPQIEGYLLTAARPAGPATPVTLALLPVEGVRPFNERQLIYRESDQHFVQDFYHVFLSPPADNIGQRLQAWLQQAGYTVLPPGSTAAQNKPLLQVRIDAMYIDVRQPKAPAAVLSLHASVVLQGGASTQNGGWLLEAREPLSSADADVAMRGLDKALAHVLTELEEKLGRTDAANWRQAKTLD